jgi:hypothetical protein
MMITNSILKEHMLYIWDTPEELLECARVSSNFNHSHRRLSGMTILKRHKRKFKPWKISDLTCRVGL